MNNFILCGSFVQGLRGPPCTIKNHVGGSENRVELLYVCWFIKPLFDENIGIRNQVMVILIYEVHCSASLYSNRH